MKPNDISAALEKCFENGELDNDYYGLVNSELIDEWYISMPNQQEEVSEVLNELTALLKTNKAGEKIALYWLMYLFADDVKLQINECRDLQSYIRYSLAEKGRIYGKETDIPIIDDFNFMGLLCAWGYSEHVKIFHKALGKDYATRYELFFDFIENQMVLDEDKKLVDNFYNAYGPKAYLLWWKNNLALYTYSGKGCNSLRQSIDAIVVNPDSVIAEQRENLIKLESMSRQFLKNMESDLYFGFMGIQGFTSEHIFTNKLSGVWHYKFLGQPAPVGFKYYMGL